MIEWQLQVVMAKRRMSPSDLAEKWDLIACLYRVLKTLAKVDRGDLEWPLVKSKLLL